MSGGIGARRDVGPMRQRKDRQDRKVTSDCLSYVLCETPPLITYLKEHMPTIVLIVLVLAFFIVTMTDRKD
jgi:hypothetical protein